MERAAFEKLEVYQLAEKLADGIWRLVLPWSSLARDTIGKELARAADSIGANIAEGYGRGSLQDNHRFVRIARGSLNETHHWLRRAYQRELLKRSEVSQLKTILDELGPRLNAYLISITKRTKHEWPRGKPASSNGAPRPNKQPPTPNKQRATNGH